MAYAYNSEHSEEFEFNLDQDLIENFENRVGITKILANTWNTECYKVGKWRSQVQRSRREKEWYNRNNRATGTGFHEAIAQKLNHKSIDGFSDLIQALISSVEQTELWEQMTTPQLLETPVIWKGKYPFKAVIDCLAPVDGELTMIEWTWREDRIQSIEELGDKRLQITAQVKACRDGDYPNLNRATIVVAHPFGEASIFPMKYQKLEQCWRTELLPRLQQYYHSSQLSFSS